MTPLSHRARHDRGPSASPTARLVRIDASTQVELDEPLQFMRTLWGLVHTLQKASKRMRRDLGVTGPQRLVMRAVGLSPGLSPGALAKILHVHPSTLTGVLKRLQEHGLVRRVTDPFDARRSALRLTIKGERINVALSGTVEAAVRRAWSTLSSDDRRAASVVLSAVTDQLESGAGRSHRAGRHRAPKLA